MSRRTRLSLMLVVFAFAGLAVWLLVENRRGPRPVDVNTGSFEQLDGVPYLTPDAARGIIADRPFGSVDELLRVNGIGEKTLAKIRDFVKVE